MSEERLLPCPFCGGEAEIKWVPWTEISESSGAYVLNVNHSPHCFIRSADGLIDGRMTDSCKERIIKAWNTRKPMERIAEKIVKECKKIIRLDSGYHYIYKDGAYRMADIAIETIKAGGADE